MTQVTTKHSYEELRAVVVDVLLKREHVQYEPSHYRHLVIGVAEVLARRDGPKEQPSQPSFDLHLDPHDSELVRDVFWDLFRQGFITLGLNDANESWPHFRLSHFGKQTLGTQSAFRFHDTGSFITMVRAEVPDISSEAVAYLDEAVASFFADCLLACCVMVGVAAELEFLRLVDLAANGAHGSAFTAVMKETFVRRKVAKFQDSLKPLINAKKLPREPIEDLETNFAMIQSVLRIARNDAGHATAAKLQREQVYVYLQLFVPFARQLMKLRVALK
jgi:hypothetical protein